MSARTPQERVLAARIAAAERWAHTADRTAATAAARAALADKWAREVDPDGKLSPEERVYRADLARRAHLMRASLAAAKVRRERRAGGAR